MRFAPLEFAYFAFIGGTQPQPQELFVWVLTSGIFSSGFSLGSFVIVITSFKY